MDTNPTKRYLVQVLYFLTILLLSFPSETYEYMYSNIYAIPTQSGARSGCTVTVYTSTSAEMICIQYSIGLVIAHPNRTRGLLATGTRQAYRSEGLSLAMSTGRSPVFYSGGTNARTQKQRSPAQARRRGSSYTVSLLTVYRIHR